ncbi:MAG TPA: FHA domain-containing protein [Acidimicrobiales bacterium]|nr:FHA domain-containing protein [Acidimicrobiales bacterium]
MSDRLHIWSADRLLVCVPADLPAPTADAVRAALAGDPSVDAVLEVLAAGGLSSTPPFVLAAPEDGGVRVVIRGELHAVAHGCDGSTLTLGAGRAATWNDDVVADIASISVDAGAARFEWFAATTPAPSGSGRGSFASPEPAPASPAPESHTLDEQEFERVVSAAAEPPAPEPRPEPEPAPAADPAAPDFTSLLEDTSHHAPEPPPAPTPPASGRGSCAPAGAAPPADPTLPNGVVPPRPASRPPIAGVPPATPAAPAPPPTPEPPAGSGTGLGEHDGRTVTLADLRRLQQDADVAPAPGPDRPPRAGEVRAVRCPQGHANPPTSAACRICDADLAGSPVVTVARPVIARLVFDSGLVVDVDRPQLIGRRPSAPPEAEEIPNLVTVPSPDSDISRAHTAVRVEGWDVLVEDVGSTNGTEVRLPNGEPVRLREHEPVLVVAGTEVTMAGAVRFRVEGPER